jgi:histidine triad (HIT) family protein
MMTCVFCARTEQPPALFETERLYVMPDKYPICPGHTLIISKDHLACYAVAPDETHRELESTAAIAQAFLKSAYGKPLFIWENGVSGQSVFHAHLHLMPLAVDQIPPELAAHPDVATAASWETVRAHYDRHGHYRYLELAGQRRLVNGHSPALRTVVQLMARATGLRYGHGGWIKTTTPEDVAEVGRRYRAWQEGCRTEYT